MAKKPGPKKKPETPASSIPKSVPPPDNKTVEISLEEFKKRIQSKDLNLFFVFGAIGLVFGLVLLALYSPNKTLPKFADFNQPFIGNPYDGRGNMGSPQPMMQGGTWSKPSMVPIATQPSMAMQGMGGMGMQQVNADRRDMMGGMGMPGGMGMQGMGMGMQGMGGMGMQQQAMMNQNTMMMPMGAQPMNQLANPVLWSWSTALNQPQLTMVNEGRRIEGRIERENNRGRGGGAGGAPTITCNSIMPHGWRGSCMSCHQILGGPCAPGTLVGQMSNNRGVMNAAAMRPMQQIQRREREREMLGNMQGNMNMQPVGFLAGLVGGGAPSINCNEPMPHGWRGKCLNCHRVRGAPCAPGTAVAKEEAMFI